MSAATGTLGAVVVSTSLGFGASAGVCDVVEVLCRRQSIDPGEVLTEAVSLRWATRSMVVVAVAVYEQELAEKTRLSTRDYIIRTASSVPFYFICEEDAKNV